MKHIKRMLAGVLAAVLTLSVLPISVFAAPENTPKEEVVYVNLNADGTVKEINVVNIFNLDADGKIIDYGKYESIRNMTSTDKISYNNETITVNAKTGKLYYEGKLSSKMMPWNIDIKYYMDDKEYKANEIAGKSGNLKITMKITENTDCIGNFFEGYALQASVTLDTDNCTNIVADGATTANVGSDKQLTYTILPNKGADIEITAKVSNFEMNAIAINGIKLNLALEIDDSLIQEKIDEIIDAVKDLDTGASELKGGAKDLYDGTTTLKDKVGDLYSGVGALSAGTSDLAGGLSTITSKNKELLAGAYEAFKGLCSASEIILNAKLAENGLQTVKLTPDTYSGVLMEILKTMDADAVYNTAYNKALAEVTAQIENQAEELYAGYVEQNANEIYLAYIESQAGTLYEQVAAGTMTEEEMQQIIRTAVESLTDEQKMQIKADAAASLTDEQKTQIRNGYIDQMMKSKEVTDQITAAVAAANTAAASVTELKCQLDNYSLFYEGLKSYTSAASDAANGADTLKINMNTLRTNVDTLKTSVGELNDGVKALYDGTAELKDGTGKFVTETHSIKTDVSSEVDKMVVETTAGDVEITSFVSEKNTNVDEVQFVMQTEMIDIEENVEMESETGEKTGFWTKLLKLFGIE